VQEHPSCHLHRFNRRRFHKPLYSLSPTVTETAASTVRMTRTVCFFHTLIRCQQTPSRPSNCWILSSRKMMTTLAPLLSIGRIRTIRPSLVRSPSSTESSASHVHWAVSAPRGIIKSTRGIKTWWRVRHPHYFSFRTETFSRSRHPPSERPPTGSMMRRPWFACSQQTPP
jgi:hypothetical protein